MLGYREKCVIRFAAQRQFGNKADASDPGNGTDAALELLEERFTPSLVVVPRRDERHLRREDVCGIESEMNTHQPPETVQQEARGHQHHHRKRYFHDDQCIVRAMLRARIPGSTALFQTLHHIGTARVQCRPKPEQYPRDNRGYEGESEDDTAHIHFIEARNTLRAEGLQNCHACMGKENPSGPSGESEKKAFGQQLPNETGSSRAECDPEDNLPAPYGISREKKAGDVRARYQQHESNRSLKDQQGRPDATDENTLKGLKTEAPPGIGIGVFAS